MRTWASVMGVTLVVAVLGGPGAAGTVPVGSREETGPGPGALPEAARLTMDSLSYSAADRADGALSSLGSGFTPASDCTNGDCPPPPACTNGDCPPPPACTNGDCPAGTVPEPGTLGLVIVGGGAALALYRWGRRRR